MPRIVPVLVALALAMLATPRVAAADALETFLDGRAAYQAGDYPRAVAILEDLLLPVPASDDVLLVCQARKFLMAGYVLVRDEAAARDEARRLLSDESCRDSALDRDAFPEAVVSLYDQVRVALEQEERAAEARRRQAQQEERRRQLSEQLRVETIRELVEVAQQQVVEERNSRWVAALPFGVGQFRNGHRGTGLFFAIAEGLLAGATFGTYLYFEFGIRRRVERFSGQATVSPDLFPTLRTARLVQAERRTRISNQVLFSVTGAVMLAGVIAAQVRYVPTRTEVRRRPLPDTLRQVEEDPAAFAPDEPEEKPSASVTGPELSVHAQGLGLGLQLRF